MIVAVVLAVLAGVVAVVVISGRADPSSIVLGGDAQGVLQSAGLLFFAFAGYARIATLGEVRDPAHTIPRAIRWSLAIALAVYLIVAVTVLSMLGGRLAGSAAPWPTRLPPPVPSGSNPSSGSVPRRLRWRFAVVADPGRFAHRAGDGT